MLTWEGAGASRNPNNGAAVDLAKALSFDTRPRLKPNADCTTETEVERSRKFLHFAAIRFIERSMLTTKSLRIESRIGRGNLDGFTYKWLIVPALS